MYIDKLFPFVREGDLVRSYDECLNVVEIYIPKRVEESGSKQNGSETSDSEIEKVISRKFKVINVLPLGIYVLDESDDVCKRVADMKYGNVINCAITDIDYEDIAERVEITGGDASLMVANAYKYEENILSEELINYAANGITSGESVRSVLDSIVYSVSDTVDFKDFIERETKINEALDMKSLIGSMKKNGIKIEDEEGSGKDYVWKWLNSYFALPEGEEMRQGSREVVPLLIGPTGVFKSATIKELCDKFEYRLVDFRVSFTSRLDYSGLYNITQVDGESFSYPCPMEELVTCSDGFREYCRKACSKIDEIIKRGYTVKSKISVGSERVEEKIDLSDEQKEVLEKTKESYKEYMKTPVLFLDEITRCKDSGTEGVLVTLLNQKRFNSMTMNGCKFVAATNLNLLNGNSRHDRMMAELDDMYDVNDNIDVAYANRFMPLKVLPKDVEGRWFEWAEGSKEKNGKIIKNINGIITSFLKENPDMVYNETPVLDVIEDSMKTEEEKKAQSFPNYRTWEMLSDYITEVEDTKVYRRKIVEGLISEWGGKKLEEYLDKLGWEAFDESKEDVDDVGDFMESTLDSGVPAMIIGPSSMGKTSRVKAYEKKIEARTGKKPVRFDINLSSMEAVDIMGMPVKKSLTEYVSNQSLRDSGLDAINKELRGVISELQKEKSELGLPTHMTIRAPDLTQKEKFEKAVKEGRDIIIFFDECNRVKNPVIMSAMFEAISDYRLFGISFKHIKDKVKIIGACNMSHSESTGEVGLDGGVDYTNAGSLDPALAARFSVMWKKKYDEKDVKSFIRFLESERKDGKIDGTLVEFLKTLETDEAIKIIASVERRCLENAEPSTRMMYQFSKDVQSMRGKRGDKFVKDSLYAGKTIFNDGLTRKYAEVTAESSDDVEYANGMYELSKSILRESKDWEPAIKGSKIFCSGEETTAEELVNLLKEMMSAQREIVNRPMTEESLNALKDINQATKLVVDAMMRLDRQVSESRKDLFEVNFGKDFARKFLPFFNENFGTAEDVEITLPMLSDDALIEPFVNKYYNGISSRGVDEVVRCMIKLINDFKKEFGVSLPPKNYAGLLMSIKDALPPLDSMAEILDRCGADEDELFAKAEEVGDDFIKSILRAYPGAFTDESIEEMKKSIEGRMSPARVRKSRVL